VRLVRARFAEPIAARERDKELHLTLEHRAIAHPLRLCRVQLPPHALPDRRDCPAAAGTIEGRARCGARVLRARGFGGRRIDQLQPRALVQLSGGAELLPLVLPRRALLRHLVPLVREVRALALHQPLLVVEPLALRRQRLPLALALGDRLGRAPLQRRAS
jgi:hypothetical protein